MKIRKIAAFLALTISMAMVSGCAKYTDITPKGQNLLNRASDLDLLMNVSYAGPAFNFIKQATLINDMYLHVSNVPNAISGTLTMNKVLLTYDESADRAALTLTDEAFESLYQIISRVANIVLTNADQASGDPNLLHQLKAEAHVVRAYLHYLLVNTYAPAYDPATAATDGGVPYVEDIDFETPNAKNTVQEVYDKMLADVNAAIASGALPDHPKNSMRVGKGFAYGVKARILLSMRDYAGALAATNEALTYNSTLEDHRPLLDLPEESRTLTRNGLEAPDNLFYAFNSNIYPSTFTSTTEILRDYYEPGNIIKDHTNTYRYTLGPIYVGLPDIPAWIALAYEQNSGGMTTSDLVLIKAECLIRTNKINDGMAEIEKIRIRRIDPAVYAPLTAGTEAEAMAHLQKTSRIEFLYTPRNFFNIKRWNKEGTYAKTIDRTIQGTTYVLEPNSPLWVFPFPQSATQFNEALTQNY